MSWLADIQNSFQKREELSLPELFNMFSLPSAVSIQELKDILSVFNEEYQLAIGLLRPDDRLSVFVDGPETRNPISWYFERSALEDRLSEVNYKIAVSRKRLGVSTDCATPETMRDYVMACLGLL